MIGHGPSVMRLAEFVNGSAFKPEDFGTVGTPVVRIKQLIDESAELELAQVPARPVWLKDGDLVFSWSGTLAVRSWHRGRALLNQHLFRVDVHPSVDRRWLSYVLVEGARRLEPLMHGSAMTHITLDMLRSLTIPLPSMATQRAIASYLDRETAPIEVLISNQPRLVGLLNERIDALIKQQIGISNLVHGGSIKAVPLKRLLRKVVQPFEPGSQVVTAYRDGEVNARANRRAEGYTLAHDESTYQGVKRGNVVVHGLDGFSGAIGTSRVDGCCSPVYHVCESIDGNDTTYIARMLRILAVDGYLGAHATSVRERAVDLRNWDLLGAIPVPLVALEDQADVVRLIHKVVPITAATIRIASLLQERRQALITAAVTGEIDIPVVAS